MARVHEGDERVEELKAQLALGCLTQTVWQDESYNDTGREKPGWEGMQPWPCRLEGGWSLCNARVVCCIILLTPKSTKARNILIQ